MSQSTNQPANNSRGLSIASMVCGIISVAACIGAFTLAGIFILILALVAVILAVQARKLVGGRNGMSTAGLVLGIIGLCLNAGILLCTCAVIGTAGLASLGAALS